MRITESLLIENHRRGYQGVCSDCEGYGLKKHGLTRSDCILHVFIYFLFTFIYPGSNSTQFSHQLNVGDEW